MALPTFTLVSSRYDAALHQPPHWHDELQITVLLRGRVEERVGSAVEQTSTLAVVVEVAGAGQVVTFRFDGTGPARSIDIGVMHLERVP